MKTKQILAAAAAAAVFLVTGAAGVSSARENNASMAQRTMEAQELWSAMLHRSAGVEQEFPEEDFLACLDIVGTIQPSPSSRFSYMANGQYDHNLYMDYIDLLMDCPQNKGLMLYVDSPGGTVYESDEMYLKLLEYKEVTSRPIYAYFASEACSGGYYISMAADEIYANRNAWTGSIGVLMSLTNYKELADKLGVREISITSGENKTMGSALEDLRDDQRALFQAMIDESYAQFVGIVADGRNMTEEEVRALADGRIYTAYQAVDNGLIDHIAGEEEATLEILEKVGLDEYAPICSPERDETLSFLSSLLYQAASLREKSSLEIFRELAADNRNGVLLYAAG